MIVFGVDGIRLARDFAWLPTLFVMLGCLTVGFGAMPLSKQPQVVLLVGMATFFCILVYYGQR
jgi:hypothetical protein